MFGATAGCDDIEGAAVDSHARKSHESVVDDLAGLQPCLVSPALNLL
jgi:hypothetical protein